MCILRNLLQLWFQLKLLFIFDSLFFHIGFSLCSFHICNTIYFCKGLWCLIMKLLHYFTFKNYKFIQSYFAFVKDLNQVFGANIQCRTPNMSLETLILFQPLQFKSSQYIEISLSVKSFSQNRTYCTLFSNVV